MLSYCFDPKGSMEERNGWQRAVMAAVQFDVTVMYSPKPDVDILNADRPSNLLDSSLRFVPVAADWFIRSLNRYDVCFYASYRHWHRLAYRRAQVLHTEKPFQIAHLVTLCGFREPGFVWQLDVPHLWGPIGGTHNFPAAFLSRLDFWNRFRERIRTGINHYQLRRCRRIRKAILKSTVIAATTSSCRDLQECMGLKTEIEIETGIDHTVELPRTLSDFCGPLNLLWSGRLRAWKALPLLLHAITLLSKSTDVRLRVVGNGNCEKVWKQLAVKLGIADKIEWHPWPSYQESLAHYRWAHVFTFTSLRDTTGTGLLESLAAGCPILGVDHQGASDIMTNECSIGVSVRDWDTTVLGFRDGIERLANDAQEWLRLSHGATKRASHYTWNTRSAAVSSAYRRLIDGMDMEQPRGHPRVESHE
jgi:glycosyltransferase involved in cell wall biosynthesis